jgi:chromosome segregation ATPase
VPTSTKTDVLTELTAREQKAESARAEANAAGVKLSEERSKVEALQGELRRLYSENPEDFDHLRQPVKPSSEAGKIAKQLEKLDLEDVHARSLHASQVSTSADQALRDYAAAHYTELLEAIEPQAEAAADEVQRCGQALNAAAQQYMGIAQRIDGWRNAAARRDRRNKDLQRARSVGIEKGGELMRQAAQFTEPIPSPTETR